MIEWFPPSAESTRPFDVDEALSSLSDSHIWCGLDLVGRTGCDSRATDPSAACPKSYLAARSRAHLELYREMLQLPAVRWDRPHQKPPQKVISLRGPVKEVRGDKASVFRSAGRKRNQCSLS